MANSDVTLPQLTEAMRTTAEALSTRRVRFQWMQNTAPAYTDPTKYVVGTCIELAPGYFDIRVLPNRTMTDIFGTFLHETAHAYADPLNLPDREAAADEISNDWRIWIGVSPFTYQGPPQTIEEFMQLLERAKGYHEEHTVDRLFTCGANAGKLYPSAQHLHTTGG